MRMRLAAPLLVGLVGLCAVNSASASHCGAGSYGCTDQPTCDAQCCFPAQCQQTRTVYKLVWDNVLEKRWHTCYQTVPETVMKQVTKTCYRDEVKTCYKTVHETCWKTVTETCCKPVTETCWKDCCYTVCRP